MSHLKYIQVAQHQSAVSSYLACPRCRCGVARQEWHAGGHGCVPQQSDMQSMNATQTDEKHSILDDVAGAELPVRSGALANTAAHLNETTRGAKKAQRDCFDLYLLLSLHRSVDH